MSSFDADRSLAAPDRTHRTESRPSGPARTPRPRDSSVVWGDESEAVTLALHWATSHTALAGDPKDTARSAEELHEAVTQRVGEAGMITPDGIGHDAAISVFDEVIVPATRASDDPMNLAYIPAAPTRAAVAFDTAVSAANIFAGTWEAGAGAIYLENQVISWLASKLGWPDAAAGTFVSGGTTGNLSALATARDHAARQRGGRPSAGWAVAMAATAHSSNSSAARLLDMSVVEVPVDASGRLTGENLRTALQHHPNVCAVVASGGTTNAGIVDDLASLVPVAHEFGAWVHVDGAYGGAAIVADSTRPLFDGIEQADSFIVDPHKWLFAPYDCCALIYRDPAPAVLAHSQHAPYLDSIDRGESNPTDLAAHLSRRARGLPLWYSLAVHGTRRYAEAVERCLETARTVATAVDSADHLDLVSAPQLSVLLFTRKDWHAEDYHRWSQKMAHEGTILCVPTFFQGKTVARLVFTNPDTDPQKVIDVLMTTMGTDGTQS